MDQIPALIPVVARKMRRALNTSGKLHLTIDEVRALAATGFVHKIFELEADSLTRDTCNNDINSGHIGSTPGNPEKPADAGHGRASGTLHGTKAIVPPEKEGPAVTLQALKSLA